MFNHRSTGKIIDRVDKIDDFWLDLSFLDIKGDKDIQIVFGTLYMFFSIFLRMVLVIPYTIIYFLLSPVLRWIYNYQYSHDPVVQEEERIRREKLLEEQKRERELRERMLEDHEKYYPYEHKDICPECGKTVAVDIERCGYYCNPGGEMGHISKKSYPHFKPDTRVICAGFNTTRIIRPHVHI